MRTTPRLAVRRRAPACLAVAVAVSVWMSGCAGEPDPSPDELERMIASRAASPGVERSQPKLSELRFEPKSASCAPQSNDRVSTSWETSAPRAKLSAKRLTRKGAELGLRDSDGTDEITITARVRTPDGDWHESDVSVTGTEWATLTYPDDVDGTPDKAAKGTYTVVWSNENASGTSLVSCDGFRAG